MVLLLAKIIVKKFSLLNSQLIAGVFFLARKHGIMIIKKFKIKEKF